MKTKLTPPAKLPEHLFKGVEGSLYDTRVANWSAKPALRPIFEKTFARINNLNELKATIRAGGFAWPGGYPLYFITADCAALCFKCAGKEYGTIASNFTDARSGWKIVACEVNYEDNSLYCDHCSKTIESAYGKDENKGE